MSEPRMIYVPFAEGSDSWCVDDVAFTTRELAEQYLDQRHTVRNDGIVTWDVLELVLHDEPLAMSTVVDA